MAWPWLHPAGPTWNRKMSASEIAGRHFDAAVREAETAGLGHDSVCRSLLGLIVSKYLTTRDVADVRSELHFVADNCDPLGDFIFMRP
jgi:hypothetical protein